MKEDYRNLTEYSNRYEDAYSGGGQDEIDISTVFKRLIIGLKKMSFLIISITMLFSATAFAYSRLTYNPMYECRTSFSVMPLVAGSSGSGQLVYNFNYNPTLGSQMSATFPYILQSSILRDVIESDIGKPINGTITASAFSTTNIFEIKVTSNSPDDAYEIVQAIIRDYPRVAESILGDTKIQVITPATKPEFPYNSKFYLRDAGYAAIIGLFLGFVIVWIYTFTRKTVISKHDIRYKLNQDYLCELPFVNSKSSSSKENSKSKKILFKNQSYVEAVKVLKKRVKKQIDDTDIKVIGITSTSANEGKTSVAYNFAKIMASDGKKILLIDMDVSNNIPAALKSNAKLNNLKISDVVAGRAKTADSILHNIFHGVDVLFARSENSKFIKSEYALAFDSVKGDYDYIIVDMPPCATSAESASIADLCDAYIYVVRCDYSSIDKIKNAMNYISFSSAKRLGVLLNGISGEYVSYGRYGAYGRYGRYGHYRKYGYAYRYNNYYTYGKDEGLK